MRLVLSLAYWAGLLIWVCGLLLVLAVLGMLILGASFHEAAPISTSGVLVMALGYVMMNVAADLRDEHTS